MNEMKYWVALNRVPHLGTVRFKKLEAYFGGMEHAWNASMSQLRAAGLESKAASEIVAARSRTSPDAEMEKLHRAGVKAINWHHAEYPPRLKEISDLPPVLYFIGRSSAFR
jgi:DNA processing protein